MKNEKVKMETVALRAVKFNACGEKRKKQTVFVRFLFRFFRRRRSINSARRAAVSIFTFYFFIFTFSFLLFNLLVELLVFSGLTFPGG